MIGTCYNICNGKTKLANTELQVEGVDDAEYNESGSIESLLEVINFLTNGK